MAQGCRIPGAGRKKGIPNLRTNDLIAILEAHGYNPVAKLIEIGRMAEAQYREEAKFRGEDAPKYLAIAQQSANNLMPYMFPKRRSVELTGEGGKDIFQTFIDVVKSVADERERRAKLPSEIPSAGPVPEKS